MTDPTQLFIDRWKTSGAAERANFQPFISELCDLLEVPHPDPATPDTSQNAYVFERDVTFHHGDGTTSPGRIDLYKRGCFVLEAKQGVEYSNPNDPPALSTTVRDRAQYLKRGIGKRGSRAWDNAMHRARGQADQYIRALPPEEGRPPFLIVLDVGHSIELFAEFTCSGGTYTPFPAPGSHRLNLSDLADPDVLDLLRTIWESPLDLDPSKKTAKVTKEIADRLARLAMALEKDSHAPEDVATFLMRCLFTMFAEDVGLLETDAFTNLIDGMKESPEHFVPVVEELWSQMDKGGFSTILRSQILQFNGGLFRDSKALPLTKDQLHLLIEAARCDWCDVEPAIFGTLLERALDPIERHKLGAHYTPRSYVERLVIPTIIEPIRAEWDAAKAAAMLHLNDDKPQKAVEEIQAFHRKLVKIRVLDPACGSGNFLYVTLEHLKKIEGEVFDTLDSLGQRQAVMEMSGVTVDPHQLLGLEVNPRAAAIAELVLWIGTLQWHFRNRGQVMPPQPVIKNFHNIECRDALIEWEALEPLLDDNGEPVTHWDGRTMKTHPVTGKEIPNESARVPVMKYINPTRAKWPEADFVVGNPPFLGPGPMRQALGDGYTEAVRQTHADISSSSDFVMFWWNHAAHLARENKIRRFGFVSTNSIRQTFNRRTLESHMGASKDPLALRFAIPDHPWIDGSDGAAVRIAMTVGEVGEGDGSLFQICNETLSESKEYSISLQIKRGRILPNLTIGPKIHQSVSLLANGGICSRGVSLHGSGFIVTPDEALQLGLGRREGLEKHIRGYRNGRDLTATSRGVMVIDLFGLEPSEIRERFPEVFQWVWERVKPERDQNKRKSYRERWWIHGEPRGSFRPALEGLTRYIATVETSKHRFFQFLDGSILPDNMLVNIATEDGYALGVLSSRIHVCWALSSGGTLEDRPRYNKTRCFETFPFPSPSARQRNSIATLAEQLDTHRKNRQATHAKLTMTGMYNVLEKIRSGEELSAKELVIHEQGLITVLAQIHDELDKEVAAAYGWPQDLAENEILERLVQLNAERAAQEAQGHIQWVRPDFQEPLDHSQQSMAIADSKTSPKKTKTSDPKREPWPSQLPEQIRAIMGVLEESQKPLSAEKVARAFVRARTAKVLPILDSLVAIGQARIVNQDQYLTGSMN